MNDDIQTPPLKTTDVFDFSRFDKPTTKAASERADLIGQFQMRINQERIGTAWPEISARGVAVKIAHMPTADLYGFLKQCKEGSSFGKVFFGSLKIRQ
jgi:hypothetical protein